ncbi:MAG: transglycosylase domain-containing protein, partial [Myxococcota bacterium]
MISRPSTKTLAAACIALGACIAVGGAYLRWPLPADTLHMGPAQSTQWTDRYGALLADQVSAVQTRSEQVSLDAISPHVVLAVLAAEDRRFFHHAGVDPLATARAAWQNLVELRVVGGGSTLTQQLARLLSTEQALLAGHRPPARSLAQKLREARLALRLEATFSKRMILTAFLNRAPFGNLAVGIEAAAQRYFGCTSGTLSVAQAAYLVGLPKGPTQYNPLRHPEAAKARQHRVLAAMRRREMITAGQLERALREPIAVRRRGARSTPMHAIDLARQVIVASGLPTHGRIRLTLDARLQEAVADIVTADMPRVYARGGRSAATVVLD